MLPEGVSAVPGPVRLWPYQREIADAISDPDIERVTLGQARCASASRRCSPGPSAAMSPMNPRRFFVCSRPRATRAITSCPIWNRYLLPRPVLRGTLAADSEEGERNTLTSETLSGRLTQDRCRASAAQFATAHRARADR